MPPGRILTGEAIYKGGSAQASRDPLREIRGGEMAMIFRTP
jgi:ABC-type dipeptide/oligopeptide/nickel transport system ATPase component